ncbi:hypothetical protein LOZ80_03265 [Paenibacillus sp. HWE-109]|uniref:hypothetical protein n=1 Tax=Paenibacillus sp. HWE-109 TaxID=1306526 RepID=UPI001EDF0098|nr:hypothetical protein [Paenibacillus sp. HWE-109]UKS27980.1 hypothetical protein LOZ80_03265 [Paenibacillus sp. HWE-109]
MSNLNFTTEDGNDGTMYPETIPPILLRTSSRTGHVVRSTGRFGRTKARAIRIEKVCQRIAGHYDRLALLNYRGNYVNGYSWLNTLRGSGNLG